MNIPLVDLRIQYKSLSKEIDKKIKEVLTSSIYIKGPVLNEFEKDFAKFLGVRYCLGVASGTDALYLSLKTLRIQKGDEVILPVNTFIATAYAVIYVGAKPVFVDVNPKTYNIDTDKIEDTITKRTKAIIPVHLYGQVADMDNILKTAKKYHLFIIEDASQAHGAKYKNKMAGSFGNISTFSFYPSKNLGCYGDGGCITTNILKYERVIQKIREYGSISKYLYEQVGINSRLDTIQAAVLQVKLKHLTNCNEKRVQIAQYYNNSLKNLPYISIPFIDKNSLSVYHLYVITTPKRNKLAEYLQSLGIQTGIHYPIPLHMQKSLSFLGYKKGDFPIAESLSQKIISLPIYPGLTLKQQDYIINSIRDFFK